MGTTTPWLLRARARRPPHAHPGARAGICRDAASTASAMGRSKPDPSLRSPAGARLTVILCRGHSSSAAATLERTRWLGAICSGPLRSDHGDDGGPRHEHADFEGSYTERKRSLMRKKIIIAIVLVVLVLLVVGPLVAMNSGGGHGGGKSNGLANTRPASSAASTRTRAGTRVGAPVLCSPSRARAAYRGTAR